MKKNKNEKLFSTELDRSGPENNSAIKVISRKETNNISKQTIKLPKLKSLSLFHEFENKSLNFNKKIIKLQQKTKAKKKFPTIKINELSLDEIPVIHNDPFQNIKITDLINLNKHARPIFKI